MSKIEVDTIDKQSGSTVTVGGPGTNLVLGTSGQSVTLGCGATQSGFGRTGTVNWQTGSIKTSTFTAVSGEGYFCNTAGGSFEVDLPAGSAGAIVSIQDYNNTFDSNALTVDPNGTEKINGGDAGATISLSTEGQGVTFVYIDATVGWRSVQDNDFSTAGSNYIVASGGTQTTVGDFKVHTFTSTGPFNISAAGSPTNAVVEYLVQAGGGGGGGSSPGAGGMGGGGAGGFRLFTTAPGSNSPLNAPAALPVSAQNYSITVGAAGAAGPGGSGGIGGSGGVSTFSSITSAGGGSGGQSGTSPPPGGPSNFGNGIAGGSGGGGSYRNPGTNAVGGTGNTPPVSPSQGQPGGQAGGAYAPNYPASGGGGAGAAGGPGQPGNAGDGGVGSFIADPFFGPTAPSFGTPGPTGSTRYFAGGGGGGGSNGAAGAGGGAAGGGTGGAGTTNTGGGGGGGGFAAGGSGGSGIVIIRYKFQN